MSLAAMCQGQTGALYWAYKGDNCNPGDALCPDGIPATQGLESWGIGGDFGGPASPKQETNGDIETDGGASEWFLVRDFRLQDGFTAPWLNATIRGVKFTVRLENKDLKLEAGSIRILLPNGTMASPSVPHPFQTYTFPDLGGATETYNIPNGANENFDKWDLAGVGELAQNIPWFSDVNFGFAFYLAGPTNGGRKRRGKVYAISMNVYWTPPGESTTAPTTTSGGGGSNTGGSQTTTSGTGSGAPRNDGVPVGAVVGAAIGGIILVAVAVLLIVYLVRRSKMSQPSIKLDAPLTSYQSF
jgi:hypothetical protein